MDVTIREQSCLPPLQEKMTVLVVSKSLAGQGGVVNFVSMLMDKFSDETAWKHLEVGKSSLRKGMPAKLKILAADILRLKKQLSAGGCHVLHFNTSFNRKALVRDGSFLLLVSFLRFKNTLVFIHGWDEGLERTLRDSAVLRSVFFRIFDRAKVLIVLAARFREALIAMGFEPAKIKVFPTMFDGELFSGVREVTKKPETILFMSRLTREKGIYELLEAFHQLSRRYQGIRLDIAGDGEEGAEVYRWIASRGLRNRVRLLGYVRGEEKARVLQGSDIFVLPTRHGEGCPVTLLEAMAAGLAVITTPAGGIPDVFADGVNGILLRDDRPAAIADAISRFLDDGELCATIGRNNRREAWQRFEARIVTNKMERIYREIVAAH